jgi:hypothetical protein
MGVKIRTVVFCIMIPYSLVGRSNNSEEYIAPTFYPKDQNNSRTLQWDLHWFILKQILLVPKYFEAQIPCK